MTCDLFVPEVCGSRRCSVCRCDIKEHNTSAVYIEPYEIFTNTRKPKTNRCSSPKRMSSFSSFTNSTEGSMATTSDKLTPSQHSAFTPYLTRDHDIIKPEARIPVCASSDEHNDYGYIRRRINGRRAERPHSVGILDLETIPYNEICHDDDDDKTEDIVPERSKDFRQILQRFQEADKQAYSTIMSPPHGNSYNPSIWPTFTPPNKFGSSNGSWVEDSHHPSRNSAYLYSPPPAASLSHRNDSPYCLSETRSYRHSRPASTQLRHDSSPDITINEYHNSTTSLSGSTPEPTNSYCCLSDDRKTKSVSRRSSMSGIVMNDMNVCNYVKETDIDDPYSTTMMSPVESTESSSAGNDRQRRMTTSRGGSVVLRNKPPRNQSITNVRHSFVAGNDIFNEKEKETTGRRRSSTTVIKPSYFLSQESIGNSSTHSNVNSKISRVNSSRQNVTIDVINKQYQQMVINHVHTLNIVANHLMEESRRCDEPLSRNHLSKLDFNSFVISSTHPILTKGKSLFYNAILPISGKPDYPVTIMIAPCSQYAPLMRKTDTNQFSIPSFFEIEDQDGSIKQFLSDTGTQNLDGRNVKMMAMPRYKLCSFHSLAAHHQNKILDNNYHEELVSFILLQLLQALKMLQGEGVESLSTNFKEFLLSYQYSNMETNGEFPKLLLLPETLGAEIEMGGDELVGLCRYALRALCTLLNHKMDGKAPPIKLKSRFSRALLACASLLQEDKSNSLTKAKNVIELSLWSSGEYFQDEKDARFWIDMARSECINKTLRLLINDKNQKLGSRDQFKIEFLLGATPRSIMDSQKEIFSTELK